MTRCTEHQHGPPRAADLGHLRPDDIVGWAYVLSALTSTALAIGLSSGPSRVGWLIGQLLLGFSLLQWFVLVHECGHDTLFRTRWIHAPVGHLASFFAAIPFYNWRRVHNRHHKWTGWQDVDPTTAALVGRELGRGERILVNTAWRWWIPIFSVLYRANNFWNARRLIDLFPSDRDRRRLFLNGVLLLSAYVVLFWIGGAADVLRVTWLGVLLSLVGEDLLLLSQHTHIPQNLSKGAAVRPFPTIEQEVFTRSLKLPAWLSTWLIHVDAHELHHMYPFVPSYRLKEIAYPTENEIGFWEWLKGAKRLRGEVFLFQNRLESGAPI